MAGQNLVYNIMDEQKKKCLIYKNNKLRGEFVVFAREVRHTLLVDVGAQNFNPDFVGLGQQVQTVVGEVLAQVALLVGHGRIQLDPLPASPK